VRISSTTRITPRCRQTCATEASHPAGGTIDPPRPAIGSTTTQAMPPPPSRSSSWLGWQP
jgi:hypothetical protein